MGQYEQQLYHKECTKVNKLRISTQTRLPATMFFLPEQAFAQHEVVTGGGTTRDAAVGESTSRPASTRRTPRVAPTRKPATAIRRGFTADQYNQQGDQLFDAKNYDDALEAYEKAVEIKPIASAHYHLGWIYNDRDNYGDALSALQRGAR